MINAEANKKGTEIISKYCFLDSAVVKKYFKKN